VRRSAIKDQIASDRSTSYGFARAASMSGGHADGPRMTMTLTEDDAKAIAAEIPALPTPGGVNARQAQLVFGNQNWNTGLQGVTAD